MDGKDHFRYEIQIGCRYVVSVFKSSFYLHLSGRTGCVIRHLPKRRISPKILVIIMGIVVLYLVLQKCGGRTISTAPTINSWKIETTVTTGARAVGILAEEEEIGWSGKDEDTLLVVEKNKVFSWFPRSREKKVFSWFPPGRNKE